MLCQKLISFSGNTTKTEISELHVALKRLNLKIPEAEVLNKRMGAGTVELIKLFQQKNNLEVNGQLNDETIKVMNVELVDVRYTGDKKRTQKLHMLLEKLDLALDREEKTKRITGNTTRQAIEKLQAQAGRLSKTPL